jgi:arginase
VNITLISSPYHLGHRDVGMGAGPMAFVDAGVGAMLRDAGHEATVSVIEPIEAVAHEIGAVFHLNTVLAHAVQESVRSGAFPIVLGGNCNTCLGTLGGLGLAEAAIVWFDAHGDFHTPETTASGFFDGMALTIATGSSWHGMANAIPGFRPVAERNVVLAGVSDLDETEEDALEDSAVTVCGYRNIRSSDITAALAPALDAVSSRVRDCYLHVDLDVLDRSVGPINQFQADEGLRLEELLEALELIGDRFQVRAAAVTAYDPAFDPEGRGLSAGLEVVKAFGEIGWGP